MYLRVLSRTGFLTQLKRKLVRINREKTSRVTIRENLSKRAVMKEQGLGGCVFNGEDNHQ